VTWMRWAHGPAGAGPLATDPPATAIDLLDHAQAPDLEAHLRAFQLAGEDRQHRHLAEGHGVKRPDLMEGLLADEGVEKPTRDDVHRWWTSRQYPPRRSPR
jgi:hypothetical protein